jgi:threonine dehydrogenase-like Zn-dependent dehydrogenase
MTTPAPPEIVVVIAAGSMGQAIARRIGVGKTIVLSDLKQDAASAAAQTLATAGFVTSTAQVDVASRDSVTALAETAAGLGVVVHVVHTAGLSPAQASPDAIIAVDLVGTAHVLDAFGRVIAPGGFGLVIAQAGHMLPPLPGEQNHALANAPGRRTGPAAVPPARCRHHLRGGVRPGQARQHPPRAGRERGVGRPGSTAELTQPGHHHDPAGDGRAQFPGR